MIAGRDETLPKATGVERQSTHSSIPVIREEFEPVPGCAVLCWVKRPRTLARDSTTRHTTSRWPNECRVPCRSICRNPLSPARMWNTGERTKPHMRKWLTRGCPECHACFFGCLRSLLVVAWTARGHHVFPNVLSTPRSWHYMVDGVGEPVAITAAVPVTHKYCPS